MTSTNHSISVAGQFLNQPLDHVNQVSYLRRLPFLLVFDPLHEAKDLCSFQDWQLRPPSLEFPPQLANVGLVLLKPGFVSVKVCRR